MYSQQRVRPETEAYINVSIDIGISRCFLQGQFPSIYC